MVINGSPITISANSDTAIVSGIRIERRSMIVGVTDFPDTVMYCLLARTTSEIMRMRRATAIRNTERAVASLSPCWPSAVYSIMRVVTILTFPGFPMMEGIP